MKILRLFESDRNELGCEKRIKGKGDTIWKVWGFLKAKEKNWADVGNGVKLFLQRKFLLTEFRVE
jgi:hypothetical protein